MKYSEHLAIFPAKSYFGSTGDRLIKKKKTFWDIKIEQKHHNINIYITSEIDFFYQVCMKVEPFVMISIAGNVLFIDDFSFDRSFMFVTCGILFCLTLII